MKVNLSNTLKILTFSILFSYSKTAISSQKMSCSPTPQAKIVFPKKPYESRDYNDLTKKEGDFENQFIDKIIIKGIVLDQNCVPVENAIVKMWQPDEYGVFRFANSFIPTYSAKYKMNYQQYSDFIGKGTATTNNLGEFYFISTIPFAKKKPLSKIGFIYLDIKHNDYPDLKTYLTFDIFNKLFKKKKSNFLILSKSNDILSIDAKSLPIYNTRIVLRGKSEYKRY